MWYKKVWKLVVILESTRSEYEELSSEMKDWDFRHLKCYLCKEVQIFMANAIGQLLFVDDSDFGRFTTQYYLNTVSENVSI